jgi:small GTP-binding protein
MRSIGLTSMSSPRLKLVLCGDVAIGKTCLVRALLGEPYRGDEYMSTLTPQLTLTQPFDRMNSVVAYQIWDIPGQEAYAKIFSSTFRDADVVLICHRMHYLQAPDEVDADIERWTKAASDQTDCVFIGVGMKADAVSAEKRTALSTHALNHLCLNGPLTNWFLTSAKTGEGIDILANYLLNELPFRQMLRPKAAPGVSLDGPRAGGRAQCC